MNSKIITNGILRALAIIVGILFLGYFLITIQSVIIYVVIAGILSLIAKPIIVFLRKKLKFPNTIAVVFTMFLMIGILSSLIGLFVPLVTEQGKSLS
jgi:predicted PurR-regulated permease PerM